MVSQPLRTTQQNSYSNDALHRSLPHGDLCAVVHFTFHVVSHPAVVVNTWRARKTVAE